METNIQPPSLMELVKKPHQIQEVPKIKILKRRNGLSLNQQNYPYGLLKNRQRKRQNVYLYFLNLSIPIVLSCLIGFFLLDLEGNQELKGYLIIIFVFSGLVISVYSNLLIASGRQVLKLYFHFDSLVPFIVTGMIGFFALYNFLAKGEWYHVGFAICFPVFAIYYGGTLRVMIAYLDWEKWQVLLYKFSVLLCAMIFWYVGFTYMRGGYKITKGYLLEIEDTFKNIVYLYVFGLSQLFFQYFRKLSQFDQTKELKYEYRFQSSCLMQEQLYVKEAQDSYQKEKSMSEGVKVKEVSKINESNVVNVIKLKRGFSRFLSIRNTYGVCDLD